MNRYKILLFLTIFITRYISSFGINSNATCHDDFSGFKGICRHLEDCPFFVKTWKYVNQRNGPTICGYENLNVIVCCPDQEQDTKKLEIIGRTAESEFISFNETCIIPGSSRFGTIKQEKYCLFAKEQQVIGVNLPRACSYEICHDLVCCPDTKPDTSKLRHHCKREWAGTVLDTRLLINSNCNVSETNKIGRYTSSDTCSYYSDIISQNMTLPRVCDWNYCKNYVCCPESHLSDSGKCITNGEPGICTSEQSCPSHSLENNENKTICGHDCCSTFICCPSPKSTDLSSSERACLNYRNEVFEEIKVVKFLDSNDDNSRKCQGVQQIGGPLAFPTQFPHMAVLGYDDETKNWIGWNCGGSLISDRFILTTAHCLESDDFGPVKYARLGIIDLNITRNLGDCPEEYSIVERIPHPDYLHRINNNDLGLVKLNKIIKFNQDIRPICLPTSSEIPKQLTAIGFGSTYFNGIPAKQLINVQLDYLDRLACKSSLKFANKFCAGLRYIQDKCPEDSGGSIEANHDNFYKMKIIYGITSFGNACGYSGSPATYTSIYPFIEWIASVVWP